MSDPSKPDSQRGWGLRNRSKTKVTSTQESLDRTEARSGDDFGDEIKPVEESESDEVEKEEENWQQNRQSQHEQDGSGRRSGKQHGRDLRKEFEQQTPKVGASVSAYDAYQNEPAYVAPIPKIAPILPRVASPGSAGSSSSSSSSNNKDRNGVPSSNRPQIPRWVTKRLVGKMIDEFGDIVDDDGKVLGRVAGDLPSMVGRTVLNQRGDVLGHDGELLGYVAEVVPSKGKGNEVDEVDDLASNTEGDDDSGSPPSPPKSIDQYTGKSSASLQVDHRGNILDSYGNIIGHFRDKLKDPKTKEEIKAEERQQQQQQQQKRASSREQEHSGPSKAKTGENPADDRPPNAAAWRKENESPSDIFLDVKSTTEGIQLTIRIPTVFPNGGSPRVNFC